MLPSLECRYEIARGEYQNALAILNSRFSKNTPVYSVLKLRAIDGLLRSTTLDAEARKSYEQQREELQNTVEEDRLVDIDSEIQ